MPISTRITDQGGQRIVVERARGLATRQFGSIARWQLLHIGFSEARVRSWMRSGRLFVRYPGVYAWGRPELPEAGELAAALLYAGRGAALGGITGLWWLGLLNRRPSLIDVDAPGAVASRGDLQIRHPRIAERRWHRGLPVVPLPRALLVGASSLSRDALRTVLARAEFEKLLDLASVEASLGSGHTGSRAVRRAMDAHLPQLVRCANGFERDFVLLCERHGLPIPEPNVRVGRYVPDMLWEEPRLIVELDGKDAHSTPAQLARDRTRQQWLESRGLPVVRFGWEEVTYAAEGVASRLRPRLGIAQPR